MSLFQNSVLNKYLKGLDNQQVVQAWEKYKAHFHNPTIQENIRNSKEEQYQEGFLRDLFVHIFGYVLNPETNFNLTTELKNLKGAKKTDGAILQDDKALAVIELKGTNTVDLAKVETQAFGYKNNQPDCVYVITSNFEKLRFYIDNAVDFEEFNLFQLSKEQFDVLYLCLASENLLKGIPWQIKDESLTQEENITKKLYKDYSQFRNEIFDNIQNNNPKHDKLTLFKKTQKLLDRFLFIFFAEDRLLLPPNSIREIVNQWADLRDKYDMYQPLYNRFKKYFGYMNTGHKGQKHDIFAYNGGLFEPDDILDNIIIDDQLLYKHTLNLSNYDFESEVSVNILGHIFEHSLTEIENIQAQLEGTEIDKSKTKRKKDGVFYTPKYITKYIVDNTVGKLCEEKKTEIGIQEADYEKERKGRKKATLTALQNKLDTYQEWLLQLTICDPACGSGAFLNQALEFLIAEHRYIYELQANLTGENIVFSYIEKSILENNLFGVDINEESVEIAKLSLWLRTAQKGRKLTTLNDNIKCGNSLIDDPEVAGDKAFNWQQEFPEIFTKDGFDVVIGNPPYVKLEKVKELSRDLEKQGFKTFNKRSDLYCLFVEKGFDILKPKGLFSFIMPNKWLQAEYGKDLREYFLTKQLNQLIDFGDLQIFQGATTYPCIFIARNTNPNEQFDISVLKTAGATDFHSNVISNSETFNTSDFNETTWVISSKRDKELLANLSSKFKSLSEYVEGQSYRGVLTGLTKAFIIDENTSEQLKEDPKASELLKPILRGRDIQKWYGEQSEMHLISTFPAVHIKIDNYSSIKNHLLDFGKKRLEQSGNIGSRKKTSNRWFETQDAIDYWEEFEKPKIMYQVFQVKPCFIYDESGSYCNNSIWIIPTEDKALLGVLNSKMGWWLITKYCTQIQNGYQLIWKYFGQIPIPELNDSLTENVNKMLTLNKQLHHKKNKFLKRVQDNLGIKKVNKKMAAFYDHDLKTFLAELKKQKITLSLVQQDEWEEYFTAYKTEINQLQVEITKTEQEIDQMVYELYGLTENEIEVVENA